MWCVVNHLVMKFIGDMVFTKQDMLIYSRNIQDKLSDQPYSNLSCVELIFVLVLVWYFSNLKRQSSCRTSCAYLTQNFTMSLMVLIFFVKNQSYWREGHFKNGAPSTSGCNL